MGRIKIKSKSKSKRQRQMLSDLRSLTSDLFPCRLQFTIDLTAKTR